MWLSRVRVGRREALQAGLKDAYGWHQGLWGGFPGQDGCERQFLFRVDSRAKAFHVYVLSSEKPTPPGWGIWQSKEIAPSFLEYSLYRFQLKANPTLRQADTRKRVGLCDERKLRSWMLRKAGRHGFAVEEKSLVVSPAIQETFVKKGRRGKHMAVDFQGVLDVQDPQAFRDAFSHGIGSAKSFGFGLLMLQPLK